MPDCPDCGRHLVRRHRTTPERLLYSDAFTCLDCSGSTYRPHRLFRSHRSFMASWVTRCPRCAQTQVSRAAKRDRVDSVSKHLFSRLQRWLGAPLYKCAACRLQYYDWRSRRAETASTVPIPH